MKARQQTAGGRRQGVGSRLMFVALLAIIAAFPAHARRRPTAPRGCPVMTSSSAYVMLAGNQSGCTSVSNYPCVPFETISFRVAANPFAGYSLTCWPHTITWNFGDGAVATTTGTPPSEVQHIYPVSGTYMVLARVTNPREEITLTIPVYVASATAP